MHRQQLRKKASRPTSSSVTDRTSTRSTSYLKTRIRGSRLLNAARILAITELTRRLHQAYQQAYDKQAADWLLPQNSTPNPDQLKKDFYDQYQKKLARCIWQVFSSDLDGQPMNTAQVMERQTLRNAPNVDMSQTMAQLGGQGGINERVDPYSGRHGTIHIGSNLRGWTTTTGQTISTQENYFRTYAHELGNLLFFGASTSNLPWRNVNSFASLNMSSHLGYQSK